MAITQWDLKQLKKPGASAPTGANMNLIRAKLKNIFNSLPRNAVGFHTTTLTLGKKPQLLATFVCFDKKTRLAFFVDRCCTQAQTQALIENELTGSFVFLI